MSKPRPSLPTPGLLPAPAGPPAVGGPPAAVAAGALRDALALLSFAHDLADAPLSPLEVQGLLILVEGRLRRSLEWVEELEGGAGAV